ncbi:MAG: signal peptidase I [Pyrinomonadaceae bacterium]
MFKSKTAQPPPFGRVSIDDDDGIEVKSLRAEARSGLWSETRLLIRDLVMALLFVVLFLVLVAQPVKVEGTSMLPRLHDGERIFVNKLISYKIPRLEKYGWPTLERGDIIVFWYPNDPDKSYVKRIIGLPGETVEVRQGRLFINGQELNEPYLDPHLNASRRSDPPVTVKEHYYFVMGDNRDNSSDSRYWGLVPEKYIYGKVLFRYWPLSGMGIIRHESQYNVAPPPTDSTHQRDLNDE